MYKEVRQLNGANLSPTIITYYTHPVYTSNNLCTSVLFFIGGCHKAEVERGRSLRCQGEHVFLAGHRVKVHTLRL